MDLSDITYETFRGRVGESFRDAESGASFELLSVDDLTEVARNVAAGARTPFSLLFRGPAEPALPQGIRSLEHDAIGELAIFVVPIAQEPDGMRYEAVFS